MKTNEQITVNIRYDELPKPVREDFLLENKDGNIQRKELNPVLKETFVDPESLSYAFFIGDLKNVL